MEATNPALGQSLYRGILDRHPGFAEAHFRHGRLLQNAGLIAEVRRHFSAALENDGLPNRCKLAFRDVYQQVATQHPLCIVIDGRKELMAVTQTRRLDDHLIEDTHHPNLKGQLVLASAVLRELRGRRTLGESPRFSLPLDPLGCCDHFQMHQTHFATACERTSVHYLRVSGYRYDPAERLEKSHGSRRQPVNFVPAQLGMKLGCLVWTFGTLPASPARGMTCEPAGARPARPGWRTAEPTSVASTLRPI